MIDLAMLPMLRVDFHTHSFASKDSLSTPEELQRAARLRRLDRLVVTDHNTLAGALSARAWDPELFIVGEEVMTTRGELLAVFVSQEVPRGLTPQEAIQRLRDQGAFISVSHPFDRWRNGAWQLDDLLEIASLVDAVEVFNARCLVGEDNRKAQNFASQHRLPGTAGTDAHASFELGSACLVIPHFSNADELRSVICEAQVDGRLAPFWVHFASRYARLVKKVV